MGLFQRIKEILGLVDYDDEYYDDEYDDDGDEIPISIG